MFEIKNDIKNPQTRIPTMRTDSLVSIVLDYLLLLILSNTKFFSVLIVEALVFLAILGDDFVNFSVLLLTPTIVVRVFAHHIRPIVSF